MEISVGHVPEVDLRERREHSDRYDMFDIMISRTWDCYLYSRLLHVAYSISSIKTPLPVGAWLVNQKTNNNTTQHNSVRLHHTRQYIFIALHKMVNPHKPRTSLPFFFFFILPQFRRYQNTNKIGTKRQTHVLYHYSYFASQQSSCTQTTPKQSLS
jgi:hypothetical protein